jgi:hypothetical protein
MTCGLRAGPGGLTASLLKVPETVPIDIGVTARELIEGAQDTERACAYCDKEHGIKYQPGSKVSHGICQRHAEQMYRELGFSPEEIRQKMEAAAGTTGFVPGRPALETGITPSMVHRATGEPARDRQAELGF